MTANRHIGEVEITLEFEGKPKDFKMRPSFEAVVEMETATGLGIVALAGRIFHKQIGLGDLAVIITAGMKAAGEPADGEVVAKMVWQTGMLETKLLEAVDEFITGCLTGGKEAEGAKKNGTAETSLKQSLI